MIDDLLGRSLLRMQRGAGFAVASVIAALLSFWTIAYLARHQAFVVQLCISSVIIALSIVRSSERLTGAASAEPLPAWVTWLARFAMIPLIALLGTELGRVVHDRPELGFALIGVPLVLAIWVRRFGPAWTRLGTLWSFPFVAALVTPAAALAAGAGAWWGALAALIAVAWGSVLAWLTLGARLPGRSSALAGAARSASGAARPTGLSSAAASAERKLLASDRMALHLALALAAAILLGWWLLPDHLGWLVLTAYLVDSGNRGRADVVYKGIQRLLGAGVGTVVATLLGTLYAPGDSTALVVLFAMLGLGAVLRTMSYAWWAAAMTGGLALLYGYLGQGGTGLLGERLLAILIGGAVAIATNCFVLPVRSIDVVRRRAADLLPLGREVLTGDRAAPDYRELAPQLAEATARVEQLAPPFHALRLVTLGRVQAARRTAELIDRVAALGHGLGRFAAAPSRELGASLGAELRSIREVMVALRRD